MKKAKIILKSSLFLVLLFCSCLAKEKEEEDYVIRVKTVANVCVTHEGVSVGEGVNISVCLGEAGTLILECQNLITDQLGCTSFITSYYDLYDNFWLFASAIDYDSYQEVGLSFAEASAGAVVSDDGKGKIYTWNVKIVLDY